MNSAPLILAIAALAGCANFSTNDSSGVDRQVEIDSHTLLADVALERQQFPTAADELMQAAQLSDHPWYAERTTRLAHQLELTDLGLRAADRWNSLAPDDERPYWFSGVFEMRSNRLVPATREFEAFIEAIGDPATGLALVLEALSNEPYADASTAIMKSLTDTYPGHGRRTLRARATRAALRGLRLGARERASRDRVGSRLAATPSSCTRAACSSQGAPPTAWRLARGSPRSTTRSKYGCSMRSCCSRPAARRKPRAR